ncbi:radical SAM family heme chaperone HemW [Crocinitomix catalasitica]|uniref:radical SAM family heme chaperone HemW n=1 Tax=Crocinitomix catalasitica TaxID=184607 RepID=UPI0004864742|nr:radical SAM family heme chaperone HemW [Crocinitomix catalasitica]
MAGIYIHIPFCKVKCHYCDFHFSVQLATIPKLVEAILLEIDLRTDYLQGETIETIYFGGGTPSVLASNQIERILRKIEDRFAIAENCEITFECNPDDLTKEKLADLKSLKINRLSIGIQSFDEEVLKYMNRAHNSQQAIEAIEWSREMGFENSTVDLIYGIPNLSLDDWKKQVDKMLSFQINHLSAYCLTIENNTVFGAWQKKGELTLPSDETSLAQFQYLIDELPNFGYEQYEISNFAKENSISKHNSAYWLGKAYLGIGPSAHSYNHTQRQWNVANNGKYLKGVQKGTDFYELEDLTIEDRFNDYILTRLRTKWGINLDDLANISLVNLPKTKKILNDKIALGDIEIKGEIYSLTNQGKYVADAISADLFI